MGNYVDLTKKIFTRLIWDFLNNIGISRKTVSKILKRNKFSDEQIQLLNQMRSDNQNAPSPYRASAIWQKLGNDFEGMFYWEGIDKVEEQIVNAYFSSPLPGDPKLLRYACWLLYNYIKPIDRFNVLEKVKANVDPSTGLSFEFGGKIATWDVLISTATLYSIAEYEPRIFNEPIVLVDLGAGWGRIGYVLKHVNYKATYIVCDLPEALLISSTYLPKLLPNESVLNYDQRNLKKPFSKKSLLDSYGLVFLGTQDLQIFENNAIDIFINIASFQEMTKRQVKEYFTVIDKKCSGVFYTQQLWDSKTHKFNSGEIARFDEYPFQADWNQKYLRNVIWSDLYFETLFEIH